MKLESSRTASGQAKYQPSPGLLPQLLSQGVSDYQPLRRDHRQLLSELRTGNGRELPQHLKAQISREPDRLEMLLEHIRSVETELRYTTAAAAGTTPIPQMLLSLKGIGEDFANMLWAEGLYRHFDNRRQVAAYAGLAPTPWQSSTVDREQGVSRAGNPRLRTALIQPAWLWTRHQPGSALTQWFLMRVQASGGRFKKTIIVALARKLVVALWKYVTSGVIIEEAVLKAV